MSTNKITLTSENINITLTKDTSQAKLVNKNEYNVTLSPTKNTIILSKQSQTPVITLSKSSETLAELNTPITTITLSRLGAQGPPGPPGPSGEGSISWMDVIGDFEYTDNDYLITDGEVSEGIYKGNTIYRFESTLENSRGYPVEDSFYSNFDGSNLSNLIVRRNT